MKKSFLLTGALAAVLFMTSCKETDNVEFIHYTDEDYALLSEKLNLPKLPPPYKAELPVHLSRFGLASAPVEAAEATLGRVLFYDKNLSSDKTISCASCHRQEIGFSDDRAVSIGVESRAGTRNSIALSSVASFSAYYGSDINGGSAIPFFWDNRAATASAQNIGSMTNPLEMNMTEHDIVEAVKAQDYYGPLFKMAYNNSEITSDRVSKAIAAFVNSMGSYQSRFDAAANAVVGNGFSFNSTAYETNFASFSAAENRGKTVYMNNCDSCHSQNFGRPVKFYANNGLDAITLDKGVGGITGASSEQGTFKVPTLRNIAITAPYMHDGRFATLEDVVEHYSSGIKSHPNLASELKDGSQPKKFNFSAQEKSDLITFLGTLTDDVFKTDERFSNPFK